MTKTQRRINKLNLIRNSRRYTVVTDMDGGAGHYFEKGTTVRPADAPHYLDMGRKEDGIDFLMVEVSKSSFPLKQWVAPHDIV